MRLGRLGKRHALPDVRADRARGQPREQVLGARAAVPSRLLM